MGSVKNINFRGKDHAIQIDPQIGAGKITYEIRKQLLDIQEGRVEDEFGWVKLLN